MSQKAQILSSYVHRLEIPVEFHAPALSHWPHEAIRDIEGMIVKYPDYRLCLVGSSLGGYYAQEIIERVGGQAVLINPVVNPWHDGKSSYVGTEVDHYGTTIEVTHAHEAQLKTLSSAPIKRPENYFLLLQDDDDIVDPSYALEKFSHAKISMYHGGGHRFDNFKDTLDDIGVFFSMKKEKHE